MPLTRYKKQRTVGQLKGVRLSCFLKPLLSSSSWNLSYVGVHTADAKPVYTTFVLSFSFDFGAYTVPLLEIEK